jgi:hypothetical protein
MLAPLADKELELHVTVLEHGQVLVAKELVEPGQEDQAFRTDSFYFIILQLAVEDVVEDVDVKKVVGQLFELELAGVDNAVTDEAEVAEVTELVEEKDALDAAVGRVAGVLFGEAEEVLDVEEVDGMDLVGVIVVVAEDALVQPELEVFVGDFVGKGLEDG